MKRPISYAILLAAGLSASSAAAQPAKVIDTDPKNADYAVEFFVDHLAGSNYGEDGAVIRVRDKTVRRTLIRPRCSFVSHLLKSVQDV